MTSSTGAIRLTQSLNYTMDSRQVGVMAVWQEEGGAVVAQLSIYDPATGRDEDALVQAGDELEIGPKRYRVVELVTATEDERAWVSIAEVEQAV